MILGTPGSPYQYGFFEFSVKFGANYPSEPPKVDAKTTNSGRTRFNPNIYAGGKVCLSILGTWHGELPGEEWSSAQGLESVLWSIQSLMSNDPYGNEPGFENRATDDDKKKNDAYCAKIRHETIRIAVIQKLEAMYGIQTDGSVKKPTETERWEDSEDEDKDSDEDDDSDQNKTKWEPYIDWQKRRFLWYYSSYLDTIETHMPNHKDGDVFEIMPFEGGNNTMAGSFQYSQLAKRLLRVKEVINEETEGWAKEGAAAKARDSSRAYAMQGQFNVAKNSGLQNVELELEDGNPFIWIMTYFGKHETNLEGGVFKLRISISSRFPEEQPRVKVVTPIYHHRVSKDGVLCYFPNKPDEMKNHVQTIIHSLEEESPPYDPRTIVNPEASNLLFGSKDEKKKYFRQMRRSAESSMEFNM